VYEMSVQGEIKALAWREGSSGIFTGSIEGLYQGYRFGSTGPDEQHYVFEVPNGSIALTLRQEVRADHPLPSRPAEHPFSDEKDPFANAPSMGSRPHGAAPPGIPGEGRPGDGPPKTLSMDVRLLVDPEKSTGLFAAATGEVQLVTPNYKIPGSMVVVTQHGDLRMNFLEKAERGTLNADLWVDGETSTGLYHNARGDLKFALSMTPPNFGRGRYSGTIWLEQEPPTT
jgi:hypothetical protein